ncbi:hypothetical protein Aspvir_009379 [Aspergillus viridinutans]|uniref:GST N-terminal domain-containing protein n=1 Tax=Aspergillus viridinutans TaxID=75553 RepID=A0A9P3F8D7_ASPVI|nr:uncharacterized protein Aspvir_009379 [Aspergillus viridinutans]GIK05275.1 hypothetical protein Aspvir_009379 [Aspergillus viridinutans]
MNPIPSRTSDTWEEAVAKYVKSLDPDKQREFQAPATVEACLQVLSTNGTRKRGFTRIAEFLGPVIDPLKRLEGTLDVIVQVNAGIASPIWGPLRMAITIACQHLSALERLAFIVDKIAQSVQRYQDLAALFASHAGVRDAVGRLYCELLRLCTCMVKYQTRRLRYIFNPFGNEFASISESVDYRAAEIDRAAQAAHFLEAKEVREKLAQETREQNLHRIRCWLCPSTVEDDWQRHLSQYSDGSCDWVLQSDQFQKWFSSPRNERLQIVGRPGSGKSTLAAFLVKTLSQYGRVLYFFCDRKNPEKKDTVCIMRTLLSQLLQYEPSMADQMLSTYQHNGRAVLDSVSMASDLYRQTITHLEGSKCYFIIIDDDDDDADYWRQSLIPDDDSASRAQGGVSRRQGSNKRAQYKFLFTRNREDSTASSHLLRLDSRYIQNQVLSYVQRRIKGIPSIANTGLAEQVADRISKQADGLWLYARLLMDDIARAPSRKAVTACLSSLPLGLSELYDRIIQENNGPLSEYERRFAQWFYVWLDISDILPDFLLQEEDRLPLQILDIVFQYVNDGEPVFDTPGLAKRLAGPLVDVRQTITGYEVAAVHQSFYQYLSRGSLWTKSDLLLQPPRARKLSRGVAAVWYFTECPESQQHLDELKSASSAPISFYKFESHFPFHYALLQALNCTEVCSDEDAYDTEFSEEDMMVRQLTEFLTSGKCLRWFEIATMINFSGNFSELLDNVLGALAELCDKLSKDCCESPALAAFNEHRVAFFKNWKYVLLKTTPWDPDSRKPNMIEPSGFSEDLTFSIHFQSDPTALSPSSTLQWLHLPSTLTPVSTFPIDLELNPNGRVPALVDHEKNNFTVFESAAILTYLAEKYDPSGKLAGSTIEERATVNQWLAWQGAHGEKPNGSVIARYHAEVERLRCVLEKHLASAENGFVALGRLTIADFAIFPWLKGSVLAGSALKSFAEYPTIEAYTKSWMRCLRCRLLTSRLYLLCSS